MARKKRTPNPRYPKGEYPKEPSLKKPKKLHPMTGRFPDTEKREMERRNVVELSMSAKMRRRAFVMEYLRSFDVQTAYIATGYKGKPEHARLKGSNMLREPYVAGLIYRCLRELDEAELITRNEVIAGLKREANFMEEGTTHSARIAAWSKLAGILEMGDEKSKGGVLVQAMGNVMVVPLVAPDNWEQVAARQQSDLKRVCKTSVRED